MSTHGSLGRYARVMDRTIEIAMTTIVAMASYAGVESLADLPRFMGV